MAGLFRTIRFQFQTLKPAHNGPLRRVHVRGQTDDTPRIDKGQATARRMGPTNRLRTHLPANTPRKASTRPPPPHTPAHSSLHHHPSHTLATRNTQPSRNNDRARSPNTGRRSIFPTIFRNRLDLRNGTVYHSGTPLQQSDETQVRRPSRGANRENRLHLSTPENRDSFSEADDQGSPVHHIPARQALHPEENRSPPDKSDMTNRPRST